MGRPVIHAERGSTYAIRARGPFALFTAPGFNTERITSPVLTPAAARGILESILWKPAIRWEVEEIQVLSPIRQVSILRNEVSAKMTRSAWGPEPKALDASANHTQRNSVVLRDVDYVFRAHFEMTERAGESDSLKKFHEMFVRRVNKGQHFRPPCFGLREFSAFVTFAEDVPEPIPFDLHLGRLRWGTEFPNGQPRVYLFDAWMRNGRIQVPSRAEIISEAACC